MKLVYKEDLKRSKDRSDNRKNYSKYFRNLHHTFRNTNIIDDDDQNDKLIYR